MRISRRFPRPAWTFAAIAFCLAAPLAQLTHGVLVSHRFCAEHLSIEDVHTRDGGDVSRDGDGRPAGQQPAGDDTHEACLVLSLQALAPSLTAPFGQPHPLPETAPPALAPDDAPPPLRSTLLSLAPKTSPPRV